MNNWAQARSLWIKLIRQTDRAGIRFVKTARLSRSLHKWFALLAGLQLLLWSASGFYMVVVPIEVIHGDMLVRDMGTPPLFGLSDIQSVDRVLEKYPETTSLTLTPMLDRVVYRLDSAAGEILVDARTGALLSPIDRELAVSVARYHYAGDSAVASVQLIDSNPPSEVRFLDHAAWRIDFDDAWGSSFYIDADSGRFISRRHTLWRLFDFLWMLHIMDYETRDDINNILLTCAAVLGLSLFAAGTWLLYFSFDFNRRKA